MTNTNLHPDGAPWMSRWFLAVLTLAVAWCAVFRILWTDWTIDPQYSYGLIVPLLAIGLLYKRWECCPFPIPLSPILGAGVRLALFGTTLLIICVIPMSEANPDWRPLGCAASFAAVTLSLCIVAMTGGVPWLKHFAFPICFFLVAVPWPRNFEQAVMFPLMSWNTTVTLEILHWLGFEASKQGNLIILPSGVLGIEEACSGIRSLQSGLMAALFFGELFLLCSVQRIILLFIAVFAALIGNICRSCVLAMGASSRGVEAVSQWHDLAGLLVLLITFGVIFECAWRWKKTPQSVSIKEVFPIPVIEGASPRFVLASVLICLTATLVLTEFWFVTHERGEVKPWAWSLNPRPGTHGVVAVPISPRTLRMLFYPDGFSEKWIGKQGEQGQVFYFQWPPGRTAAQAVSMHNPEVCLSNVGMVLKSMLKPIDLKIGMEHLFFNAWLFEDAGSPVYVFHMLKELGSNSGYSGYMKDSPFGRLRAVLNGHRNHGQRMLEVAFWNLPNENAAREALARYVRDSVVTTHSFDCLSPVNQ